MMPKQNRNAVYSLIVNIVKPTLESEQNPMSLLVLNIKTFAAMHIIVLNVIENIFLPHLLRKYAANVTPN